MSLVGKNSQFFQPNISSAKKQHLEENSLSKSEVDMWSKWFLSKYNNFFSLIRVTIQIIKKNTARNKNQHYYTKYYFLKTVTFLFEKNKIHLLATLDRKPVGTSHNVYLI